MVALNFQTPDVIMAVNQAMFEQSGNCGWVTGNTNFNEPYTAILFWKLQAGIAAFSFQQKPRVFWDTTHPLHGKFNPLSKDVANSSALLLNLTVRFRSFSKY